MEKLKQIVKINASLAEAIKGIVINNDETIVVACNEGIFFFSKGQWIRPREQYVALRLWNIENREIGLKDTFEITNIDFIQSWVDIYDDYQILIGSQKDLISTIWENIPKNYIGDRKYHISCKEGEFDITINVDENGVFAW